ncbi:MAG: acyltransferase [Burkholderiales bacterium]|nr:acyltransferase [Burkholderiales bacterium]
MALKLERYKALVSGTEASVLEAAVRNLLIHYFFHVSDRQILQVRAGGTTINLLTPAVFKGAGRIILSPTTVFGVPRSPGSYSCSYIEARTPTARIEIGDGTVLNNRATLLSEGAGIRIGDRCLIGADFEVMDTNAHELALGRRHEADTQPLPVEIGDDVFIGSKVVILKGCRIGKGCVIAAGSVLPPKFAAPEMSIIAGNPAKVIGQVPGAASP